MQSVGELIKAARKGRKVTRAKLGEQLGMTGQNLYLIERGDVQANVGLLERIARILGIDAAALVPSSNLRAVPVYAQDQSIIDTFEAVFPGAVDMKPSDLVAFEVQDDSMSPVYRKGDVVAGTKIPVETAIGRECIVGLADKTVQVGTLVSARTIAKVNGQLLADLSIVWTAPIGPVQRAAERQTYPETQID